MAGDAAGAVPRPDGFARTRTLHVRTGFMCQNDCIFCCDYGTGVHGASLDPPYVRHLLEQNVGLGCVEFTAHEPTLNPHLPLWASWARELGYPIISVVTNGRLLGRGDLLARLLAAGINRIQISLHAHTPALHDRMARRRGSFADQLAGVRAVLAARGRDPRLTLHLHTTVTAHNVSELPDIIPFILGLQPDAYGLNCVFLTALAERHADETAVRYSAIVAQLQRCLPAVKTAPIFVSELPLCQVAGKLAVDYFGLREAFHLAEARQPDAPARPAERGFDFGPQCATCALRGACDGVPPAYVARYGWEEFVPVTGAALALANGAQSADLQTLLAAPAGEWTITGTERRSGFTTVHLTSPQLPRPLTLQVRPRDDAFPAFARTATLNITLAGPYHAADEIRLARQLVAAVQGRE